MKKLLLVFLSVTMLCFCISATAEENVTVILDYVANTNHTGMYVALDAKYYPQLENPTGTVLFAETSNMGAGGTYDPSPFKLSDGSVVPFDGFLIGYDDGNMKHTEETKSGMEQIVITEIPYGVNRARLDEDAIANLGFKLVQALVAPAPIDFALERGAIDSRLEPRVHSAARLGSQHDPSFSFAEVGWN